MNHTPGPWSKEWAEHNISLDIYGPDGSCIATIRQGANKHEANAEFIVRACNAHEELVKALQGVLHHNAAVKSAYQLPESLVRHITKALTTIEKGA